jgi:hypothetical protein
MVRREPVGRVAIRAVSLVCRRPAVGGAAVEHQREPAGLAAPVVVVLVRVMLAAQERPVRVSPVAMGIAVPQAAAAAHQRPQPIQHLLRRRTVAME